MRGNIAAFAAGILFAVGLALGGMTQPAKIIAFVDFFGAWDPSLMAVMGGAILIYAPLYRLVVRRGLPLFASRFVLPTRNDIDPRLIAGAALFGAGWGLAGYCPGPGIASLAAGVPGSLTFVLAMLTGMLLFQVLPMQRLAAKLSTQPNTNS